MRTLFCVIFLLIFSFSSFSQDVDLLRQATQIISDTTNDICTKVETDGKSQTYEISGDINAAVGGIIKKLRTLLNGHPTMTKVTR